MIRINKAVSVLSMSAVFAFGTLAATTSPASAAVTTTKTVHVKSHYRIQGFGIQHVKGYRKTVKITKVSGYTRRDKNGHIVHVGGYTRKTVVIGPHKTI
jgi:hypothetical protein